MTKIKYTQIFFDEDMSRRKEELEITWNDAAFLGIEVKEKMKQLDITSTEDFVRLMNQLKPVP
jgi:hypothetical protein